MKPYSRLFLVLAFLSSGFSSEAKSGALKEFISKVSASCVSFDYSFTAKTGNSNMKGSGKVKVQGNSFFMEGNGLEVWCDGTTSWTIDTDAEEAVIENVEDSQDAVATNPALLISSVDALFSETSFGTSEYGGKVVDVSVLSPLADAKSSMDIVQMKLYFKSGTSSLLGARVKFNDGTVTDFTVSNVAFSERVNVKESFRFNEKTLGHSYVITDLR